MTFNKFAFRFKGANRIHYFPDMSEFWLIYCRNLFNVVIELKLDGPKNGSKLKYFCFANFFMKILFFNIIIKIVFSGIFHTYIT